MANTENRDQNKTIITRGGGNKAIKYILILSVSLRLEIGRQMEPNKNYTTKTADKPPFPFHSFVSLIGEL